MKFEKPEMDHLWRTFVHRAWPLRHIPFLDFVLGSGSMALGTAAANSDFDVLIGARAGRIFTVRFLAAAVLDVFGWRRRRLDHRTAAAQKICLNHFVTPSAYRLSPPYNAYWRALYPRLVPLVGDPHVINDFFRANRDWVDTEVGYAPDSRHRYQKSTIATSIEMFLRGSLGNSLERILKKYQIARIERSLGEGGEMFRPRIRYTDEELEFHPVGWKELPQGYAQ